jgi:SNF family Na+-dependent transporter
MSKCTSALTSFLSHHSKAFFIPYLMSLFIIGLPVLLLEIALGQYYQTGDVGVCK